MLEGKSARSRTTRVHLSISVFIYGSVDSGAPFKEITQTETINANGCLLQLAASVVKDQPLLLTNMKSNEEIACLVVSVGSVAKGKAPVGLRFSRPSPRFWGLAFPPDDWDPADRKRPAPGSRQP
jgi:hypothetical protein